MSDHRCEGASCKCMDGGYSRKRTKKRPTDAPSTLATFVPPTFEPLAGTLAQAAEQLEKPIEEIQAAAAQVVPLPAS